MRSCWPRRSTGTYEPFLRIGGVCWQYSLVDVAHKVVGVGSVGLRAYVALLGAYCRGCGVPAAQAGPPVRVGAVRARRVGVARTPGSAGSRVPAGLADCERPVAGLDHDGRAAVLRAAVPEYEGHDPAGRDGRECTDRLCGSGGSAARQGTRPDERHLDDLGLHRPLRSSRQGAMRFRPALRRPDRSRPRRVGRRRRPRNAARRASGSSHHAVAESSNEPVRRRNRDSTCTKGSDHL